MLVLEMRLPLVSVRTGELLLGGNPVVAPVVELLVVVVVVGAAGVAPDVSVPRVGVARMRSRTNRGTSAWSVAVSATLLAVCSSAVG